MFREEQDSKLHIQSALDDTQATRIIRSHRAPKEKRRSHRVAFFGVVVAMALGASAPMSYVHGTEQAAQAAEVLTVPEPRVEASELPRVDTVSRSKVRVTSARTVKLNRAISFALKQRGDRYKWGAVGPSRWDCSGLVMKSFQQAGIKLPHFTGGILKHGKKISRKNLQRGDIVFPQRGHVAIYLGNGMIVHASSGKGKVVTSKLYGFYAARRVL